MLDKVVFLLDLCTCSQQYNMAYSGLFFQELGSFEYPCVCVLITQSCPAFCDPHGVQSTRLCCPWNSPVKNTGVGCHSLLQGIFPTPGTEPRSPVLQADSFTNWATGKPLALLGKGPFPFDSWVSWTEELLCSLFACFGGAVFTFEACLFLLSTLCSTLFWLSSSVNWKSKLPFKREKRFHNGKTRL